MNKVAVLTVLVIIAGIIAGGWYYTQSVKEADALGTQFIEEMYTGEFDQALDTYRDVRSHIGASSIIIAGAERDAASLSAIAENTTGVDDIIENVQALRKVVADENLDPSMRAEALNVLIQSYSRSGENPVVLQEIFKDEPYRSHLVEGKIGKSLRNLYLWSLEIYPSARAAISIASINVRRLLNETDLPAEDRTRILEGAQKYLAQAEELADLKMQTYEKYAGSMRYTDYRILHAYTIAGLAILEGAPYTSRYKKEYDDLIAFIRQHDNQVVKRQLVSVEWNYAVFLSLIDKNATAAQQHLAAAAGAYRTYPFRPFADLVRNKKNGESEQGFMTQNLFKIADTSLEFKALVDSIN